jgi:hypothetical protein
MYFRVTAQGVCGFAPFKGKEGICFFAERIFLIQEDQTWNQNQINRK